MGIAGLEAGVRFVRERGVEYIRRKEVELAAQLIEGLRSFRGLRIHGTEDAERQTPVVSFTVAGKRPNEVSHVLDEDFGIMSRPGLQCAPAAHRTIGTFPEGTVRLSLGAFSEPEDVEAVLAGLRHIIHGEENHP